MTLFGSGDTGRRCCAHTTVPLCPCKVHEYQKIPPLINHIPVKTRRTHLGAGSKSSLSPQPGMRSSTSSTTGWTKLQAEELQSIKGELSQIKAQVDNLLERSKESEKRTEPGTESPSPVGDGSQELQGKEGRGADEDSNLRNIDSAESTDTEEMMKTYMSDPKGSQ
ncbi:RNA-binding Raly-like protein [Sylvia atricapilla]|uniref:RNA-binding Raly-like protein n=1 Tax=Sylvia atricapilla TaxID=48155 RepID=UPI0033910E24